jgi:hypothetical protein
VKQNIVTVQFSSLQARTGIVLVTAVVLLTGIGAIFWQQDWRYALPTPRPSHLVQPPPGSTPKMPAALAALGIGKQTGPVLLHFFNPDCPCSRFNIPHIRELKRKYGRCLRFIAVLQGRDARQTLLKTTPLDLDMESIVDTTGAIAGAVGVYSTPQAVLLDAQGRLYYRGNYNTARYCSNPATEFARLAIEALLAGRPAPPIPSAASRAYGCSLPANEADASR